MGLSYVEGRVRAPNGRRRARTTMTNSPHREHTWLLQTGRRARDLYEAVL